MVQKKIRTEAERMATIKANATPPEACSPAIPVSPARGPMATFQPREGYMTENGPRIRREPMPGGLAARVAGPLEVIEQAARQGRDAGPVFTVAQHVAAGEYAALYERVASGRVKCTNLDGGTGGGGGSVMDAIVHDIARLRRMDREIGSGVVLSPEGAQAMPGRRPIHIDRVVEWVLIRRAPLSRLLEAHGWARQSRYLAECKKALARALDAIHGF